jgi:hypothetical protein
MTTYRIDVELTGDEMAALAYLLGYHHDGIVGNIGFHPKLWFPLVGKLMTWNPPRDGAE